MIVHFFLSMLFFAFFSSCEKYVNFPTAGLVKERRSSCWKAADAGDGLESYRSDSRRLWCWLYEQAEPCHDDLFKGLKGGQKH